MATFAYVAPALIPTLPLTSTVRSKSNFSASSYAAFRPSYPASLYQRLLAFHRGPRRVCLDLGCGTGIVTREMSKHFDRVVGTDPSANMAKQARESVAQKPDFSHVEFIQASAEDGGILGTGEVDMVVAGQAAHWFDYEAVWPEMKRLIRQGGTLAFWGYKDHVFVDFPLATEIMQHYAYDMHPDKLGSYWPQPGRSYVQDKLRIVQPPASDWEGGVERIEYEPATRGKHSGEGTLFMEKRVTVGECKEYMRTWSSYHGWQEQHPEQTARIKGGEGDILDYMLDEIAKGEEHFRDEANMISIEWGSGLVMARRR